MNVYPNPNNGSFTVYLPTGKTSATINQYDLLGKTVKQINYFTSNTVQVNNLKKGFYFMKVIFINGKSVTKKMVVE